MPLAIPARPRRVAGGSLALLFAAFLVGCEQTSTDPRATLPPRFSTDISLPDLQNHLATGAARLEVRLIPGKLTARRVEIEEPKQMTQPEEVRSVVTAVSAGTNQGTVTLALGGLQLSFNSSTRFRPDDGDADQDDMALAAFVARIQADLTAGRQPTVKARRPAPATPQAPGDATFLATELKLDEGNNHPLIELNVTIANLSSTATPPADATLKLLGLSIALEVSDGTTKLAIENPELEGVREFEGIVHSVDQTAGTATLNDGTIIRIVAGTQIEEREGDEDDHLASLAAVQAALAAGQMVKAEGKGLVDATNPLTLDAIRIEFEVEERQPPPPLPPSPTP